MKWKEKGNTHLHTLCNKYYIEFFQSSNYLCQVKWLIKLCTSHIYCVCVCPTISGINNLCEKNIYGSSWVLAACVNDLGPSKKTQRYKSKRVSDGPRHWCNEKQQQQQPPQQRPPKKDWSNLIWFNFDMLCTLNGLLRLNLSFSFHKSIERVADAFTEEGRKEGGRKWKYVLNVCAHHFVHIFMYMRLDYVFVRSFLYYFNMHKENWTINSHWLDEWAMPAIERILNSEIRWNTRNTKWNINGGSFLGAVRISFRLLISKFVIWPLNVFLCESVTEITNKTKLIKNANVKSGLDKDIEHNFYKWKSQNIN